jgi:hypothetical protein
MLPFYPMLFITPIDDAHASKLLKGQDILAPRLQMWPSLQKPDTYSSVKAPLPPDRAARG